MSTVYCYGSMRGHSRRIEARQNGILQNRDGFFGGGGAGFFCRMHRILHCDALSKLSPVHTLMPHTYVKYARARRRFVGTYIGNLLIACHGGVGDGKREPAADSRSPVVREECGAAPSSFIVVGRARDFCSVNRRTVGGAYPTADALLGLHRETMRDVRDIPVPPAL